METGAVLMDDETRKGLLVAYQKRKQEEIMHPFINEKVAMGLLAHMQALLSARYLRGDLDGYPPVHLEIGGACCDMFVLVSYDVATTDPGGRRRLRRVAKTCRNYGQRVQYSVFECIVDPAQWVVLRQRLIDEIESGTDSLRFYYLGSNWQRRVEHVGAKPSIDQEGPLIV